MKVSDLPSNTTGVMPVDPFLPERVDPEFPADDPAWGYAFVEIRRDGTFGSLRLLATTALADATAAQERAMADGDWSGLASALVTSHALPRILTGTADDLVVSALRVAAVGAAQPVLLAALALARRDTDTAEAALDRAAVPTGPDAAGGELAHRLGVALARLTLARLKGDAVTGMEMARRSRELLAQLPISLLDEVPELAPMLDAHQGSLQASTGNLHGAARTLTRWAGGPASGGNEGLIDCAGQLALLEAFQGDLRRAERRAMHVLSGAVHAWQAGDMHACTAMAWVHLERGEQVPARHYLDLVATEPGGAREPWLTTCLLLAEARLLMDGGQPEAASRLLVGAGSTETATGRQSSPRLADLRSIALAEALLAVGEPQRALAMITPGPANALVEAATLTAAARSDIGDLRGARAALATVASDLAGSPLDLQIQSWLIEARLAQSDGDAARARLLVDRALRAGAMEDLRRPFMQQWHWLQGFIDRDASLTQDHHAFLRSVQTRRVPHPTTSMEALRSGRPVVGTLTERESQVLALLAQMCTTDEIAAALFVSVNTVKTHLKGIFGKFGVNRRADAVRRGRELGLC